MSLRAHGTWKDQFSLVNNLAERNNIEWEKDPNELKNLVVPVLDSDARPIVPGGVRSVLPSAEIKQRLFPNFKNKKNNRDPDQYRLLFATEHGMPDGKVCIKGACQHKTTGKIALLSCTNVEPDVKHHSSLVDGWYVYGMEQAAHSCYWNAFKAVV